MLEETLLVQFLEKDSDLSCVSCGWKGTTTHLEKGSRYNYSQERTKPEVFLPLGIRVDFL